VFESRVLRALCGFEKQETKGKIVSSLAMETYRGGEE
jgi:hypothetical protein